jgi:hypothetical protein
LRSSWPLKKRDGSDALAVIEISSACSLRARR